MLSNFFSIPAPPKNISSTCIGMYSYNVPRHVLCVSHVSQVKNLKSFKRFMSAVLGGPYQIFITCARTFTRVLCIVSLLKFLKNSLGTIGQDRNINALHMGLNIGLHGTNIGFISIDILYWSVIKRYFLERTLVRVRKTAGFFRAQFLKWTGKRN